MVIHIPKKPSWLCLAMILMTVNLSTQQNIPNTIEQQLQNFQQIVLDRLDTINNNMIFLNDKMDLLENAINTVGDRSSWTLTELMGAVNNTKEQLNLMHEERNLSNIANENQNINISQKIDALDNQFNATLGNLNIIKQEFSTELDEVENQLNNSINTLKEPVDEIKAHGFRMIELFNHTMESLRNPVDEINLQGKRIINDLDVESQERNASNAVINDLYSSHKQMFKLVDSMNIIINQSLTSIHQPLNESDSEVDIVESSSNNTDVLIKHMDNGSFEIKTHNIGQEFKSMKDALVTNSLQLKMNLQPLLVNISEMDTEFKQELQIITQANSDIKMELQDMKNDISHSNSNITSKLDSIQSVNSNLDSKLDSVIKRQCVSDGLFLFAPTGQCFMHLANVTRNWNEADAECRRLGLSLAKPANPVALIKHMVTILGSTDHTYIGARSDGKYFKWQRDGKIISNYDPNWWASTTTSGGTQLQDKYKTADRCLSLLPHTNAIKAGQSYFPDTCSTPRMTLCELVFD